MLIVWLCRRSLLNIWHQGPCCCLAIGWMWVEEAGLSGSAFLNSWTLAPRPEATKFHNGPAHGCPCRKGNSWRRQLAVLAHNYRLSEAAWTPSMSIQSVFHAVTILETRCTGDAQIDEKRRREGRRKHTQQTDSIFLLLTKHLPFTSTQINPRTGSAKRGKLACGRLAVSANWSQT